MTFTNCKIVDYERNLELFRLDRHEHVRNFEE